MVPYTHMLGVLIRELYPGTNPEKVQQHDHNNWFGCVTHCWGLPRPPAFMPLQSLEGGPCYHHSSSFPLLLNSEEGGKEGQKEKANISSIHRLDSRLISWWAQCSLLMWSSSRRLHQPNRELRLHCHVWHSWSREHFGRTPLPYS